MSSMLPSFMTSSGDPNALYIPDPIKPDESLLEPLRKELLKLKEEIDPKDFLDEDELKSFLSDDSLKRFLIARKNDFAKTCTMAKAAFHFNCEYHPTKIRVEDFKSASYQGTWRFMGHAKNGWPVTLIRSRLWSPSEYSVEEYTKMVAFYMETNIKRMKDPQNGRNFVIFDMKVMNKDLAKTRVLCRLATDYYPERLGVCVIVNSSYLTATLWTIVKQFLDSRTTGKIRFYTGTGKEFLDTHIGAENIYSDLGGERKEDWPPLTVENQSDYL